MRKAFNSIAVKHNIEVAHRLFELPGKCEQIHGHSMWVTLQLEGELDSHGILGGIEFGTLKKEFRHFLDTEYDHRLLLNQKDPFAHPLYPIDEDGQVQYKQVYLPGLQTTMGDPTTENIAVWVTEFMERVIQEKGWEVASMITEVWETSVNMAQHEVYFELGSM